MWHFRYFKLLATAIKNLTLSKHLFIDLHVDKQSRNKNCKKMSEVHGGFGKFMESTPVFICTKFNIFNNNSLLRGPALARVSKHGRTQNITISEY